MSFGAGGGTEKEKEKKKKKKKEKEEEEKISHTCESIGHWPLWDCCPKRATPPLDPTGPRPHLPNTKCCRDLWASFLRWYFFDLYLDFLVDFPLNGNVPTQ